MKNVTSPNVSPRSPMKSNHFLHRVNASIGRFDSVALQALPVALAGLSDQFEVDTVRQLDQITAIRIVFSVANKLRDSSQAQNILESSIREAVSDRFATEVLNEITTARNQLLEEPSAIDKKGGGHFAVQKGLSKFTTICGGSSEHGIRM
jgi:hypothetical protein